MGALSITKHNELIESSYRLSLTEARIIFYGLSLVNPTDEHFNYQFKIDIKSFAKMFGLENDQGLYSHLKDVAMNKFWLREVTFPTTRDRKLRVSWLSGIEYGDKEGYLKIFINPQLQPLLHQLHDNFTSYHLENISKFNSIYSVRFYELFIMKINKSRLNIATFKMKVQEIRGLLELKKKYDRFANFKAKVLIPAKNEINKYSDIKFKYEVIKQGRSPYEIKFTITRKKEMLQPLKVSLTAIEEAQNINAKFGSMLDIYAVEQQFYEYSKTKGLPKNTDSAFIGFVKKKLNP